ncbi:MAG: hypothetical protein S4CHLAM81_15520 [Chlamydiales bacterium]|nr:hypothetical protein [Chlamydiales bacterium]MCH9636321.1 hypothetical protein [Chlamydiales bacterium]
MVDNLQAIASRKSSAYEPMKVLTAITAVATLVSIAALAVIARSGSVGVIATASLLSTTTLASFIASLTIFLRQKIAIQPDVEATPESEAATPAALEIQRRFCEHSFDEEYEVIHQLASALIEKAAPQMNDQLQDFFVGLYQATLQSLAPRFSEIAQMDGEDEKQAAIIDTSTVARSLLAQLPIYLTQTPDEALDQLSGFMARPVLIRRLAPAGLKQGVSQLFSRGPFTIFQNSPLERVLPQCAPIAAEFIIAYARNKKNKAAWKAIFDQKASAQNPIDCAHAITIAFRQMA